MLKSSNKLNTDLLKSTMAAQLLVKKQIQSGAQAMRRFNNAENLGSLQRLQQNLHMQISDVGNEFCVAITG
jgi:hypothetical protein